MSVAEPQQMAIEELRPAQNLRIMDLVAEAGIDVAGWAVKANGQPVENPSANPNYCFEWAFGGDGSPIALCVWHDALESRDGRIVFKANLRAQALRLETITFDRRAPRSDRSRAKDQATRSRRFDERIQQAYRKTLPVRLIIVDGDRAADGKLGLDSSKVRGRKLDDLDWYVHSYSDKSGEFLLARGVVPPEHEVDTAQAPERAQFVDQFSIEGPEKRTSTSSAYARSEEVRRKVLERAAGNCECCGEKGFVTRSGEIFLETHHVLPLSEDGPDHVCNVVALCPNDHRRAHYGVDRLTLRHHLFEYLATLHPAEVARIRELIPADIGD